VPVLVISVPLLLTVIPAPEVKVIPVTALPNDQVLLEARFKKPDPASASIAARFVAPVTPLRGTLVALPVISAVIPPGTVKWPVDGLIVALVVLLLGIKP